MSGAGRLVVEGAGLAAAVVILAIWAGAQQRAAQSLLAQAPQVEAQVKGPQRGASIEALATRAEEALMSGDEPRALQAYQAVLALEPHHQEAGLREVELFMGMGREEEALRALMPRMTWMVPGGEAHARALCLEAGGRMTLEPERAMALAAQACEAGAEACCAPWDQGD